MFDESNSDSYLVQGRRIIIHRMKVLLSFWFCFVEKSVVRVLNVEGRGCGRDGIFNLL